MRPPANYGAIRDAHRAITGIDQISAEWKAQGQAIGALILELPDPLIPAALAAFTEGLRAALAPEEPR